MPEKKKYRCGACNWKFVRNYLPQLCPYCGKASIQEDLNQSAGDILQQLP
jgi:predicted RNA-binding Zn-ribbon protein involved in translation (DUF1610 family)